MNSPYASVGAKLVDNGYSAIPIMPGTKRPGVYSFQGWFGTSDWQRFCDRLPTEYEYPLWEKWPDAGVCVAIDNRLKVIDIDTDDDALMRAVLSVLPDSNVKKRGNKGFSAFYRGSQAIVNQPFSIVPYAGAKSVRVVDLLAHGRQTVLPPTIHPDLQKPYEWLTDETLIDTDVSSLPELPDNIADLLATALEPFGYVPTQEHRAIVQGDGDTMWREVNDNALRNLDAWVPQLRLPGTKKSGRGYRAVAVWRGVDNPNLSFHEKGITDWGDQKNYTPIDIVMAASSADFYTATKWLCDQIGYKTVQDSFDVAGFIARSQAKSAPPTKTLVMPDVVTSEKPVEVSDEIPPVAAPRGTTNPFDFTTHGGLLGQTSRWIYETARVPVAEFATIGALAFLSAFFGRRYVTPTGAGLNIYIVGVAGAGFGKDHPRRCVEKIGHSANMQRLIGPNDVTSDTAIEKVVRRRPCFVMPWDEIGVMLQGVSGKQSASWTRSIRKSLLELYSRSTGVWTGKEHADSKSDSSGDPVYCPTVSVLGMSTPTEFYAGITEQNLQDGMVARMTVITASERPARNRTTRAVLKVPPELVEALKKAYSAAPKVGNLAAVSDRDPSKEPFMHPVEWGNGAEDRWYEIETWQLDQIDENPEYQGIVGRSAEQTIKYATIRALSRDPAAPVVTIDDVEWGYALVQRSIDAIDEGVQKHMAGSEFERLWKEVENHIVRTGKSGIAKSVLMKSRGVSRAHPRDFDAAVKWLIEAGKVRADISTSSKGGRPGVRYFADAA